MRLLRISAANIGPDLIPPEADRFVTDIDTALMQQVLYIAE